MGCGSHRCLGWNPVRQGASLALGFDCFRKQVVYGKVIENGSV